MEKKKRRERERDGDKLFLPPQNLQKERRKESITSPRPRLIHQVAFDKLLTRHSALCSYILLTFVRELFRQEGLASQLAQVKTPIGVSQESVTTLTKNQHLLFNKNIRQLELT
ncbi:hypothetical protein AVEN_35514-1 [Araneus ventricosus]|uniref:Uncharacterized protein n=1 Tax=Araneus ventricosus TaxID=182803 RepID=A0A4Y2GS99_ARAVE|nr:hypothetical protein AVEN_35514-1 [Araneus ventricosus]